MPEPFEYDTDGAPCALVAERPVVAVPNALVERFPDDQAAIDMGLDSYLAVCLRAADGTHLGHLAVLDARPMEADDDEIAALRVFASRAAAELERRRQAAALEASRARVVQAGDAERRRIGRDLHDGAQQRLVAVTNLLKVAQRQLDEPAKVDGVLAMAIDELSRGHAELRDLARGLHPVALGERGLRAAVESLAATCTAPRRGRRDRRAAARRRRAQRLLRRRRVARERAEVRARGRSCASARGVVGEALVVEVRDDGVGGADVGAGTGLCGLQDRVEALGGRLDVVSPAGGGTSVRAVVPLAR